MLGRRIQYMLKIPPHQQNGKARACDFSELSPSIYKYRTDHYTRKIKGELEDSWNISTYSRYTRGFYVSRFLTNAELTLEAEKQRVKYKEKQKKKL